MTLKIVADENIPQLDEWFAPLGEIRKVSGRQLTAEHVRDADVLLVRSVTQVDEQLLKHSPVKFVGTATIGTDHLDKAWLAARDIRWVSAPGSNATSVVEYVLAALAEVDEILEQLFRGGVVGIVGGGNVGSRLHARLQALNIKTKVFDPLLAHNTPLPLVDWSDVLDVDVLCFHTPLTHGGDHPTFHMLDEDGLKHIADRTLVLNAGRGAAIDNRALLAWLNAHPQRRAVLDVWENEPAIHPALFARVHLGTPHIAGYSLDGKFAGSWQLYQALCAWLRDAGKADVQPVASAQQSRLPIVIEEAASSAQLMRNAIRAVYAIRHDHDNLAAVMRLADEQGRRAGFDLLRKQYPVRREFSAYEVVNAAVLSPASKALLTALGFVCA